MTSMPSFRSLPAVALLALGLAGVAGCTSPMHSHYDHGRAYTQAFTTQPDLSRASAAASQHNLQGLEAVLIRLNTIREATDKEQGDRSTLQ